MSTIIRVLILSLIGTFTCCTFNFIDYRSHIEPENGEYNYALYLDNIGIGDLGFHVLKIEKEFNPKEVYIEWNPRTGSNREHSKWVYDRKILFNYAEAGFHTNDPKIELIENRFLVFSRGGFYYLLFDIKTQKDTFNLCCPWHEFREKSGYFSEKLDRKKEKKAYTKWAEKNIHDEIKKYIENNREK